MAAFISNIALSILFACSFSFTPTFLNYKLILTLFFLIGNLFHIGRNGNTISATTTYRIIR